MTKFRRTVDGVSEYKEVVSHAEALGFEAIEHYAYGKWEDNKGIPVFLNNIEVEKVGRKYFHIPMSCPNGIELVPAEPVYASSSMIQTGTLEVTFEG